MKDVSEYDVIVVGSGEGGKYLAWHLAMKGLRTAVVERRWVGGSCPNVNCLPSKNELWSARVAHLVRNAARFGTRVDGIATDMRQVRRRTPDGEALVVSANDPLNLAGTVLPGAKVPRLSGARVLYRDGIAQAALVAGEFQALATLSAGDEQAFRRALLREPDPFDVAALVAAR